ncbi:MAG: MmcQ/YjbR family DNA-binding protein [Oscillospiraceae bacterium]
MKRNQIFTYVKETHGTLPEYLFQKYPDIAVLRNTSTKKWYGVIMNIPQNKVGVSGNQKIDVLVIKGNPDNIVHLVEMEGFAPAYHMNKKHWLSIILDRFTGTQETIVMNLLDESYQLSGK